VAAGYDFAKAWVEGALVAALGPQAEAKITIIAMTVSGVNFFVDILLLLEKNIKMNGSFESGGLYRSGCSAGALLSRPGWAIFSYCKDDDRAANVPRMVPPDPLHRRISRMGSFLITKTKKGDGLSPFAFT
jgi:hypothetical protein